MSTLTTPRKTLADLAQYDGKAELVNGRIVPLLPTGDYPSEMAQEIYVCLRAYVKEAGKGIAKGDGVGYAVSELHSGRESFSPGASYFDGDRPARSMGFLEGPPTFAVEVRSENDYGDRAETLLAAKRADYFEAGTLVVWDVDARKEVVRVYRLGAAGAPTEYRRGTEAEAEPAVPGWRMNVDGIFDVG